MLNVVSVSSGPWDWRISEREEENNHITRYGNVCIILENAMNMGMKASTIHFLMHLLNELIEAGEPLFFFQVKQLHQNIPLIIVSLRQLV